jgi:uncharacterized membrane protein YfcA
MGLELLVILPSFLALGVFVGFCAGLLGIGGGLILVPGLYYLLKHFGLETQSDDVLIHTALATSMAIILPTGISSSWAQIKRKAVDWPAIKMMIPGLTIGVIIGIAIVSKINSEVLKIIFSVGLTAIAASIIFKKENSKSFPVLNKKVCAIPFSIVFGILATFLGIGGAVLNVPYLNRAGLPLKTAIATGSVLGAVIAFVATIGYLVSELGGHGYINFMAFLMIVPASVIMAPIGVRISHTIPVGKLKIMFASMLILVAAKMFFEAL